jgi:Uma2 family endonuclease
MLAIEERTRKGAGLLGEPPSLQNGDRLRSQEFLRRYEAMPEIKKAELIEGIVYMGSPVSAEHGEPDGLINTWLGTYAAHTPGVRFFCNTTVILDADNTPQPDACLCLQPGRGGRTRISAKKYLVGAPELIVEVAASSASIDLNDKMDAYARNGVSEYLVWRTLEKRFDWFELENENYVAVRPDARGLLRSKTFPGLVLDVRALLAMNAPKVLTMLQRGLASAAHKSFIASLR